MTDAPELPRRFYERATVTDDGAGFGVALDARTLRTPGGAVFTAPTRALAELCAKEWDEQGEHIIPASMPASQLAFATLDQTTKKRGEVVDYVAAFAQTDLCCHRAATPVELAAKQAARWDPIVNWADAALGVRLPVVIGIIAADVAPEALATLRARVAAVDDFRLTALAQATSLAGSVLIGFALLERMLTPGAAFDAAALDNLWSLEHWGEDDEARARLVAQHQEFHAIARYVAALQP